MDNIMKRTRARVRATVSLVLIVLLLSLASIIETTYTRDAVVDKTEGLSVHFVDSTGHGWWYDDCYAEIGDEVKLIMHTNNTDNYVEDDIIKDIKFVENR